MIDIKSSVRFFPSWNVYDTTQIAGLIQLVLYIHEKNPDANTWLEIGSNIGESTSIFLSFPKIKRLDCIDISPSSIDVLQKKFFSDILDNRCSIHLSSSASFAQYILDDSLDVVYIDGDHSYDAVRGDISLYFNKIKSGGFICGHDYNHGSWPEVVIAVNQLAEHIQKEIISFKDTSWLIRKD